MKKKKEEKILKWRLKDKPTVDDVTQLLDKGLLSKDEARQIILDETDIKHSDILALQDEIKLLRELVLKISEQNSRLQVIKIIERNIDNVPFRWTQPYTVYCSNLHDENSGTFRLN